MTLEEIRDEIVKYAESRGSKLKITISNDIPFFRCEDTFTLNYIVGVVDHFINKKDK